MIMYKLKIKPLEIENIMDSLIQHPFFTTDDNVLVRKAGIHLKQLRKDNHLIIANDRKTGESYIALRKAPNAKPEDVLKIKGRRVSYEFDDFYFL